MTRQHYHRPTFHYPPGFPDAWKEPIEQTRTRGELALRESLDGTHTVWTDLTAGFKYAAAVFTAFADACLSARQDGFAGDQITRWVETALQLSASDTYHLLRELDQPAAVSRSEQVFVQEATRHIKGSKIHDIEGSHAWRNYLRQRDTQLTTDRTDRAVMTEAAGFPNRARWLRQLLADLGSSTRSFSEQPGAPDRATLERILNGIAVKRPTLDKLAAAVGKATRKKIMVADIPDD